MEIKPTSVIKAELGIQPNGRVQRYFTELCYKYMDKYVPKRVGNLRDIVTRTSNSITYEQEYAEIQYYGIIWGYPVPPENYTTAGTGPYWDKRMLSADKIRLIEEVQRYVNRGH